jgi:hypothetical protein
MSTVEDALLADKGLTVRRSTPWEWVIAMERLPQAGGVVRWHLASNHLQLLEVFRNIRGGSWISFYFQTWFDMEIGREGAGPKIEQAWVEKEEIVGVAWRRSDAAIVETLICEYQDVDYFLSEAGEDATFFWAEWPDWHETTDIKTVRLPDADGVMRPHAY